MSSKILCANTQIVDVDSLIPNPKNPNKHPAKQIAQLAKIIKHQGQRLPIVVSKRSGFIVAGHGRLEAIKSLGWAQCAVDEQEFASEADEYAHMIADNKIAELAEHDDALMIQQLKDMDFNLDLDLLGMDDFKLPEIVEPQCDEDEVPEQVDTRCKRGDVWQLGSHRLMCGDSTVITDVEKLMSGEKADLLHTDPPYNVDYSNQDRPKPGKTNLGRIANDSMSDADFKDFLVSSLSCAYAVLKPDSSAYIWYASKESINFINAVESSAFEVNQQIIWKKPMLLGRGKYQWAHEPCIFAVKGKPYFTDDRTKTTVWDFGGYDKSKNVHPTQKPVFIPEEAMNNSSKEGSNILDLFGGSGSTLIACEKTGRKCYMMELDEHYCDVILARWEKYTGKQAERVNG